LNGLHAASAMASAQGAAGLLHGHVLPEGYVARTAALWPGAKEGSSGHSWQQIAAPLFPAQRRRPGAAPSMAQQDTDLLDWVVQAGKHDPSMLVVLPADFSVTPVVSLKVGAGIKGGGGGAQPCACECSRADVGF
jgi:hypothetical protein